MPLPRLLIDEALSAGAEIALDEAQARHVGTVLRLDVGDMLRVVQCARRRMARARHDARRSAACACAVEALLREAARHAGSRSAVRAGEASRDGSDRRESDRARRARASARSSRSARSRKPCALDRSQAIAREAAEQTERFDAPEIVRAGVVGEERSTVGMRRGR